MTDDTDKKILIFDIETAPAIGLFFGKPYEVNIAKIIQHEYVFGFCWKWLGEAKTHSSYIWDYPSYDKTKSPFNLASNNSVDVIREWAGLVKQADVIIGHNSNSFDYKHMFGRLVLYNLPPVPKPIMIDTRNAARQIGWYPSNKLDDLGGMLGTGRKLPHNDYPNAIDLWWDCMRDKRKAKRHMVAYNKIDVERTEALYLKFRPYMASHPNLSTVEGIKTCPRCGSAKLHSAGFKTQASGLRYRKYQCQDCGGYTSSHKKEPSPKERFKAI